MTGCYEDEKPDPLAGKSEEQKEFEAMELVQMMNKLSGYYFHQCVEDFDSISFRSGVIQPCKLGPDGRPYPISHILELRDDDGKH